MIRSLPLFALIAVLLASTGCALRPRYAQLVQGVEEDRATFQLIDAQTKAPIANARVEVGSGKQAVRARTDADGRFELPVRKQWLKEDPIVVVTAPGSVRDYQLVRVAAPPPVASSPWEDCEITAPGASRRMIKCGALAATLQITDRNVAPKALLEALLSGIKASFRGQLTITPGEVELLGRQHKSATFESTLPGEGQRTIGKGAAVVVETDDALRSISCVFAPPRVEDGEERCLALVRALAEWTPDPTVGEIPDERAGQPPMFRGQALVVPPDCQPNGDRLVCPTAALVIREESAEKSAVPLEAFVGPLRTALGKVGTVTDSERRCTVGGVETTCRVFHIERPEQTELNVIFARVEHEGSREIVECDVEGPVAQVPSPCDQVLAFPHE